MTVVDVDDNHVVLFYWWK